jgi:hypothetical protein
MDCFLVPVAFIPPLKRFFMRSLEAVFNRSGLSRFLNSPAGRIFRLLAGVGFLVKCWSIGYLLHQRFAGWAALWHKDPR